MSKSIVLPLTVKIYLLYGSQELCEVKYLHHHLHHHHHHHPPQLGLLQPLDRGDQGGQQGEEEEAQLQEVPRRQEARPEVCVHVQ